MSTSRPDWDKYPDSNSQTVDGVMPPEDRPINHDTTQPWKCMGCPMTSEDVERLVIDISYDPELHLCSRCKPDLTSVTLALTEAIVLAHVDADGSVIERLENLERHVLEAAEDGSLDVRPAQDDESQDDDAPDKRYEESVRLVEALWLHRDALVSGQVVDTFAARYSETNEVLNRQWGAINEVRKLLGLDSVRHHGSSDTKRALFGALGGAMLGLALGLSKNPMETLKVAVGAIRSHMSGLGIEVPDL